MNPPYRGPTVAEAMADRIRRLQKQIEELQEERKRCFYILQKYRHSTVTEAERLATNAEPFQSAPLPE